MKKKVRKVATAVVVTLLLGTVGLLLVLGVAAARLIGSSIESSARETLGLDLQIDQGDFSLLSGNLTLQGLAIDNPPGYQHQKLLELESGTTQIEIKTWMAEKVSLKTLRLRGVDLYVEQNGLSSNLQDVMAMIEKSRASRRPRRGFEIDSLEISDIRVRIKLLPLPGKKDTVTLNLAPIKMKDLGKDSELDAGSLSAKLLLALFEGVFKMGLDVLPGGLIKKFGGMANFGKSLFRGTWGIQTSLKTAGTLEYGAGKRLMEAVGPPRQDDPNTAPLARSRVSSLNGAS